jgi:hypothetical protein
MTSTNGAEPSAREQRLAAQAEKANSAAWTSWAENLGQRFSVLENRFISWFGRGDDRDLDGDLPQIIELTTGLIKEEARTRAEALTRLADILTERLSTEVAVLSDDFSKKLDSRIFDLTAMKAFRTSIETSITTFTTEFRKALATSNARVSATASLAERNAEALDRIDELAASLQGRIASAGKLQEQRNKELADRLARVEDALRTLRRLLIGYELIGEDDLPALAVPALLAPPARRGK